MQWVKVVKCEQHFPQELSLHRSLSMLSDFPKIDTWICITNTTPPLSSFICICEVFEVQFVNNRLKSRHRVSNSEKLLFG
jgi:hypothetical protein